jgi:2-phospho-L-lactate guanylyltransferase (CobY/MobA/RfbA family)
VRQRAVLVFADHLGADLARRRLPLAADRLFQSHKNAARVRGADVHLFTSAKAVPASHWIHPQSGTSFAERLENAVESLAAAGYSEIVVIGRDCPALAAADVALAFERLAVNRLVLGPDHRGGCYLIGLRAADRALLRGIRWKRNTDCAELRARCDEVSFLTPKHDLDSLADFQLLARTGETTAPVAALFVILEKAAAGLSVFVDLAAQAIRTREQMPPPLPAS